MANNFLELPEATVIDKPLPKAQFYKHFGTAAGEQAKFDENISRIYISNLIAESTIALKPGNNIKQFYVIQVLLKEKDYSEKSIITIAKNIPQNMIFGLCCDDELQLAAFCNNRYLHTDWKNISDYKLKLNGLDIEALWTNLISEISGLKESNQNTEDLTLALNKQSKIEELKKKLASTEKKARLEVQPRQKFALAQEAKKIKNELNTLMGEE